MNLNENVSPKRFVEVFGPALEEYLGQTYGKEGAYFIDLLPQAAEFFSVSYHAVSALQYAEMATDSFGGEE